MTHSVLIDLNNWGFSGMATPTLNAGERETQAIYSVIRSTRAAFDFNQGSNIIMLDDGRSWRKDIYPEYKGNRIKTDKDVQHRENYYEQKNWIKKGLELLGVRQIKASNWEADDLAYSLSRKLSTIGTVTLLTADHDWQQLINENVDWFDIIRLKRCNHKIFQEVTGFKDTKQFIEGKCILGDVGDNVIGIKGIGPKALEGVYSFDDSIVDFLNRIAPDPDYFSKHIWKEARGKIMPKAIRECDPTDILNQLYFNLDLVDLGTDRRPAIEQLIDVKGKFDEEGFKKFCYENSFLSIIKDFDNFIKPFKENPYVSK